MGEHHPDQALAAMMELVGAANGYAESQAPWSAREGRRHRARRPRTCRDGGGMPNHRSPTGSCSAFQSARGVHDQLGVEVPLRRPWGWWPRVRRPAGVGGADPTSGPPVRASPIFPRVEAAGREPEQPGHPHEPYPGVVDSHAHLQHQRFDADRERSSSGPWPLASSASFVPGGT